MANVRKQAEQLLAAGGLFPGLIRKALNDGRLEWTGAALEACAAFMDGSELDTPGAVLWSQFLQHGEFPPVPEPEPEVPPCPVYGCDLAICKGLHGWAAAFRDRPYVAEVEERAA